MMACSYGRRFVQLVSLFSAVVLTAGVLLTTSADAGQSSTPIKVGFLGVKVGSQTDINTLPAFTAWVKWTNAHGGLNGHPIQLIAFQEPTDPAIALTDAKKLIGDGIVALAENDVEEAAWVASIEQAGIPVFPAGSGYLVFAGKTNAFTPAISALFTPEEIILSAQKIGVQKLAVMYCTEFAACSQAVPAFAAVGKKFGVAVPFSAAVSGSAPNYVAQCLAAKAAGATGLFIASTSDVALRVVKSCAQQGYLPHLVTDASAFAQSWAGTKGTNGLIASSATVPFSDTKVPAIRTMTEAFNKYEPQITKSPAYSSQAVLDWATGQLIAEAVKVGKVGTASPITAAAVSTGAYAIGSTNLGGLTPMLTITAGQPQTNRCFFYTAIRNNTFSTPYGLTSTCIK